jgi:hypothetical protein
MAHKRRFRTWYRSRWSSQSALQCTLQSLARPAGRNRIDIAGATLTSCQNASKQHNLERGLAIHYSIDIVAMDNLNVSYRFRRDRRAQRRPNLRQLKHQLLPRVDRAHIGCAHRVARAFEAWRADVHLQNHQNDPSVSSFSFRFGP